MAELVLSLASAILDPVIEKLSSEFVKQLGLLWGLKGDLNKLKMTLEDIKDVLNDAEQRATTEKDVRIWLWDLKDVAYDADDVLDDVQVEVHRRSSNSSVLTAKVHDFFSSNNHVAFRYDIAKKIKKINTRLNEIEERRNKFKFLVSLNTGRDDDKKRETFSATERETFSDIAEEEGSYGRDDDKKRIMTFLLEEDNDKPLSVLPIVGLGGVGKTTLAKMVFNDKRTKEQFEPLIWVCVSDNFKVTQVITKIIHTIEKQPYPLTELENMREKLRELIRGKKFFLILDDIWNDGDLQRIDDLGWAALKSLISRGELGSKVIVTTRDHNVAKLTGTLNSHQLKSLEFDYCWQLFRNRAFKKETKPAPWMDDIGRQIVKKCGGLPLAAKALGGLMGSKQKESEWVKIRDSEIWTLPDQNEIHILPELKLSYLHLPAHLKQCFVYCSLFPKDFRFQVNKLIELWIIEGFIYPKAGEHPTDIGYSYYRALLRQSFFQDEEEEEEGEIVLYEKIIRCSMHDLVHDLACSIAGPEFAFQGRILSEPADKWRYLSVDLGDQLLEREKIIDAISKARKLRSFISFNQAHEAREIDMLSGLPYLRVLSLEEVVDWIETEGRKGREVITALHNVIPRLKHLRLLDLSECGIEALPDAITSLHSLQVLDLPLSDGTINLPRDMSKLTKLEKLQYFVVLKEPGCTIAELQQLNMLRGDLAIFCLELVKDAQEAKMANLIEKKSLRGLGLFWERGNSESDINKERGNSYNIIDCMNSLVRSSCCCNARFVSKKKETTPSLPGPIDEDTLKKHVVDNLQPPLNLEKLVIHFYDGTIFPSWMTTIEQLSKYQNLSSLSLRYLAKCKHLPPLGQLPHLKELLIHEMPCLEQIGSEFYGDGRGGIAFPSLETLKLEKMPNLEQWLIGDHQRVAAFPRLEYLEMSNLGKCKHLPPLGQLPRLKDLRIEDMPCLEQIGSEFYGDGRGGIAFPSLETLLLFDMPNLELWLIGDHQRAAAFPRLKSLKLSWCPKLMTSCLPSSITSMELRGTNEQVLSRASLGGLSSKLKTLSVSSCTPSSGYGGWYGLQHLTALEELRIESQDELVSLPVGIIQHRFPSLRRLTLDMLHNLRSLCNDDINNIASMDHQEGFHDCCPSLRRLVLYSLRQFRSLSMDHQEGFQDVKMPPFSCSPLLQHLEIIYCPKLTALPEWLEHLPSLESIRILDCENPPKVPQGLSNIVSRVRN